MRLFRYAAIAAALALSGCIDMDMNTEILGPDQARVSGYMQVQRGMLDMMGGANGFCSADEGGTLEMTDTHARCNLLMEGSFAEVFEAGDEPGPQVRDLGDGTVQVVFPVGSLAADAEEMRNDPQAVTMMRPMLEGHVFTLRISGAQVVSSNGDIAADGRSAVFTFPLERVFDADAEIPETFEAVVRY